MMSVHLYPVSFSPIYRVLICVLITFGAWMGAGPGVKAETVQFLSVLPDVPLATGLTEIEDSAVSFDTPDGRYIEVQAQGRAEEAVLLNFYQVTLPQMGWSRISAKNFRRNGENLVLQTAKRNAISIVKFTLRPE